MPWDLCSLMSNTRVPKFSDLDLACQNTVFADMSGFESLDASVREARPEGSRNALSKPIGEL